MKLIIHRSIGFILIILFTFPVTFLGQPSHIKYKDRHGRDIRAELDLKRGSVKNIYNFYEHINNYGLTLEKLNKELVKEMAEQLINDYAEFTKISSKDVSLISIDYSGRRWFVKFEQAVNGVPIEGSRIGFQTGLSGEISEIYLNTYPSDQINTKHSISLMQALSIVKGHCESADIVHFNFKPQLVIVPEETDSAIRYHILWRMIIDGCGTTNKYYIDALDGQIFKILSNVRSELIDERSGMRADVSNFIHQRLIIRAQHPRRNQSPPVGNDKLGPL